MSPLHRLLTGEIDEERDDPNGLAMANRDQTIMAYASQSRMLLFLVASPCTC
jgi:hypothetical protein